ncbi:transcriptional regulator, TetR family [Cryptosporangium aurantiacum]|uniref:Transcriptional regulator, TetR family n=1 Tax=Cryptosporangium aurantiacum TaxID=134849 RepID=A0A1M7RN04_9ACTN|nr:transcriptional regulator, TetR family [Cryptosporangium aurantiacum]
MTRSVAATGKRAAILRAALVTFAERGVNGVAVPEIATQAQVGTGTIYRYFPNKEALVNELYQEQKRFLQDEIFTGLDEFPSGGERFTEFWRRLAAFARAHPEAYRFLELQDHRPYLDRPSRELEVDVLAPALDQMRRLRAAGVVRSDVRPEVLMALIWGAFVNLFKAERSGHLVLTDADITAAGEACWTMCVASSSQRH